MRTFLVKRVMKPRRTAKTRPTRVPPILTMRKEAAEEEEEESDHRGRFRADVHPQPVWPRPPNKMRTFLLTTHPLL